MNKVKIIVNWCKYEDNRFDWYSPCLLIDIDGEKSPMILPERMSREEAEEMVNKIIRMAKRDDPQAVIEYVD